MCERSTERCECGQDSGEVELSSGIFRNRKMILLGRSCSDATAVALSETERNMFQIPQFFETFLVFGQVLLLKT